MLWGHCINPFNLYNIPDLPAAVKESRASLEDSESNQDMVDPVLGRI
jgi:hypothetical protein